MWLLTLSCNNAKCPLGVKVPPLRRSSDCASAVVSKLPPQG